MAKENSSSKTGAVILTALGTIAASVVIKRTTGKNVVDAVDKQYGKASNFVRGKIKGITEKKNK